MYSYRYSLALAAAAAFFALPAQSNAQLYVGIGAPPILPVYAQPAVSAPNEIWTPGYWAWGPSGYYWVPGTWVAPPATGLLYTPGYWSGASSGFMWNSGYWAPSVGYYGGVNYGLGYYGNGYAGGQWNGGNFAYNTAVSNVNTSVIRNVYVNRTVIVRNVNRVSYNGGPGGLRVRPTPAQLALARGRRYPLTPVQREHILAAARNRALLASVNHGRPPQLAVARPLRATPVRRAPIVVHHAPVVVHHAPVVVHHAPVVVHHAPVVVHHAPVVVHHAPVVVHHAPAPAPHPVHPAPAPHAPAAPEQHAPPPPHS